MRRIESARERRRAPNAAAHFDIALMDRGSAAREGARAPGASAIGCVVALDGRVAGEGHDEVGIQHAPPHAEMVAIRRACADLGRDDLRGTTLYSTLQPCGMRTMSCIWAHIGRIVYGAGRGEVHQMYFEDRHLDTMDFIIDAYRRDLEMIGAVCLGTCAELYCGREDDPPPSEQGNL